MAVFSLAHLDAAASLTGSLTYPFFLVISSYSRDCLSCIAAYTALSVPNILGLVISASTSIIRYAK